MKIKVQRADGSIETINFTIGTWTVGDGIMTSEAGFDHFFTHDGHYDGWGQMLMQDGLTGVSMEEAMQIAADMSAKREIEPS